MRKILSIFTTLILIAFLFSCLKKSEDPKQPVKFSHQKHFQYFAKGEHRKKNLKMHEEILGEVPENLKQGECLECHGTFKEAALDIPKIKVCSGCHEIFLKTDLRQRPKVRPCVGCHREALNGYLATIPNIDVCIACHEKESKDPEENKLIRYLRQGTEIKWIKIYDYLSGNIIFSHEMHAGIGKVDCRQCHGEVDNADVPLKLQVKLKMETCINCHQQMGASNDCLVCHK